MLWVEKWRVVFWTCLGIVLETDRCSTISLPLLNSQRRIPDAIEDSSYLEFTTKKDQNSLNELLLDEERLMKPFNALHELQANIPSENYTALTPEPFQEKSRNQNIEIENLATTNQNVMNGEQEIPPGNYLRKSRSATRQNIPIDDEPYFFNNDEIDFSPNSEESNFRSLDSRDLPQVKNVRVVSRSKMEKLRTKPVPQAIAFVVTPESFASLLKGGINKSNFKIPTVENRNEKQKSEKSSKNNKFSNGRQGGIHSVPSPNSNEREKTSDDLYSENWDDIFNEIIPRTEQRNIQSEDSLSREKFDFDEQILDKHLSGKTTPTRTKDKTNSFGKMYTSSFDDIFLNTDQKTRKGKEKNIDTFQEKLEKSFASSDFSTDEKDQFYKTVSQSLNPIFLNAKSREDQINHSQKKKSKKDEQLKTIDLKSSKDRLENSDTSKTQENSKRLDYPLDKAFNINSLHRSKGISDKNYEGSDELSELLSLLDIPLNIETGVNQTNAGLQSHNFKKQGTSRNGHKNPNNSKNASPGRPFFKNGERKEISNTRDRHWFENQDHVKVVHEGGSREINYFSEDEATNRDDRQKKKGNPKDDSNLNNHNLSAQRKGDFRSGSQNNNDHIRNDNEDSNLGNHNLSAQRKGDFRSGSQNNNDHIRNDDDDSNLNNQNLSAQRKGDFRSGSQNNNDHIRNEDYDSNLGNQNLSAQRKGDFRGGSQINNDNLRNDDTRRLTEKNEEENCNKRWATLQGDGWDKGVSKNPSRCKNKKKVSKSDNSANFDFDKEERNQSEKYKNIVKKLNNNPNLISKFDFSILNSSSMPQFFNKSDLRDLSLTKSKNKSSELTLFDTLLHLHELARETTKNNTGKESKSTDASSFIGTKAPNSPSRESKEKSKSKFKDRGALTLAELINSYNGREPEKNESDKLKIPSRIDYKNKTVLASVTVRPKWFQDVTEGYNNITKPFSISPTRLPNLFTISEVDNGFNATTKTLFFKSTTPSSIKVSPENKEAQPISISSITPGGSPVFINSHVFVTTSSLPDLLSQIDYIPRIRTPSSLSPNINSLSDYHILPGLLKGNPALRGLLDGDPINLSLQPGLNPVSNKGLFGVNDPLLRINHSSSPYPTLTTPIPNSATFPTSVTFINSSPNPTTPFPSSVFPHIRSTSPLTTISPNNNQPLNAAPHIGNPPVTSLPTTPNPSAPFSKINHPTTPFPITHHPSAPFPASNHPTTPYPTTHHPTAHFPTSNHPTKPFPTTHPPTAHFPTSNHPTSPFLTSQYPSTPFSVSHSPATSFPTTPFPVTSRTSIPFNTSPLLFTTPFLTSPHSSTPFPTSHHFTTPFPNFPHSSTLFHSSPHHVTTPFGAITHPLSHAKHTSTGNHAPLTNAIQLDPDQANFQQVTPQPKIQFRTTPFVNVQHSSFTPAKLHSSFSTTRFPTNPPKQLPSIAQTPATHRVRPGTNSRRLRARARQQVNIHPTLAPLIDGNVGSQATLISKSPLTGVKPKLRKKIRKVRRKGRKPLSESKNSTEISSQISFAISPIPKIVSALRDTQPFVQMNPVSPQSSEILEKNTRVANEFPTYADAQLIRQRKKTEVQNLNKQISHSEKSAIKHKFPTTLHGTAVQLDEPDSLLTERTKTLKPKKSFSRAPHHQNVPVIKNISSVPRVKVPTPAGDQISNFPSDIGTPHSFGNLISEIPKIEKLETSLQAHNPRLSNQIENEFNVRPTTSLPGFVHQQFLPNAGVIFPRADIPFNRPLPNAINRMLGVIPRFPAQANIQALHNPLNNRATFAGHSPLDPVSLGRSVERDSKLHFLPVAPIPGVFQGLQEGVRHLENASPDLPRHYTRTNSPPSELDPYFNSLNYDTQLQQIQEINSPFAAREEMFSGRIPASFALHGGPTIIPIARQINAGSLMTRGPPSFRKYYLQDVFKK